MKTFPFLFILIIGIVTFTGCRKNKDGCEKLSGDEYLHYEYFNPGGSSPELSPNPSPASDNVSWEEASATLEPGEVVVKIPGVRVRDEEFNYEITDIIIDEAELDSDCYQNQSEFNSNSSFIKTDIATVLVLDMSKSLEDIIGDLKDYAKTFVNLVVESTDNSLVAVVFFNEDTNIQATDFYNRSNVSELLNEIDNYTNFKDDTALFEATMRGVNIVEDLDFEGEKSLVVFSDGGDNDSNSPSSLVTMIQNSQVNRFAIGLEGNDFRLGDLEKIAPFVNVAKKEKDLEKVFDVISKGVVSIYDIIYERSNQDLPANDKIEIRFQFETEKIK